ncbi:MAG: TerC family protein [Proteobacteria bacterium]|nr:MAG: TerC family protein [Pseudomonadota bacterium]
MDVSLFPMAESWWLYLVFLGIVLVLLTLDLGVFHKESHVVTAKEAGIWTVVWISLAMLFNVGLYYYSQWHFSTDARFLSIPGFDAAVASKQVSLEFLTGYLVEKALAVDNIFVFIVVFGYFAIPPALQHRVLFYGIMGALVFRGIFIALGSVLMQYEWVVVVFGVFLIFTAIKLVTAKDKEPEPENNILIKLTRKIFPVTPTLEGDRFFVKKFNKLHATPLFLGLLFLEFSDIVFAVDSVPAIFAITKEPFIVFTSNIFAILGLRSMYFLLANIMDKFYLLKYGLSIILAFVGLKMVWLNKAFDGHFPISWSLGIIGGVLLGSIVLSLVFKKKEEPA